MFLGWKNQYCEKDPTTKCNLQIQCNPYQITNGTFHRTRTKKKNHNSNGYLIFDKWGRNRQWGLFNKWCWKNWTDVCKIMKLKRFLTPYTKINKMDYRPNCKTRSNKTVRGNHRLNTLWYKSQQDPLWPTPKVMEIKAKINKWDLIKLFRFKSENTAFKMGENNSKWNNWQRINFQNKQASFTTQ